MPQGTSGSPWPYDAIFHGVPVMLTQGREPGWVEQKINYGPQLTETVETEQHWHRMPPEIEDVHAWETLSGGMGLGEQDPEFPDRYHYALGVDASCGWPVMGPKVQTTQVIASVRPSSAYNGQFIEFNGILYLAFNDRLYKRADDTSGGFTLVNDFNLPIGQMAVFRGTQSASFLFIPLGAANAYQVMATNEALTAHGSQQAEAFETVGNEIWLIVTASGRRQIRKSTDGGTAATWGSATDIGDGDKAGTWLKGAHDQLFVLKEDGIFAPTTDATVIDEEIAPQLRPLARSYGGRGAVLMDEWLILPGYGDGLHRYNTRTGELEQFGLETLPYNNSEVAGITRAVAVQQGLALWAGVWNPSTEESYIVKYGGWRIFNSPEGPEPRFVPAWHGSLTHPVVNEAVVAMYVTSQIDSAKPRLYALYDDGTNTNIRWFKISRTANPLDDPSHYEFSTTTSTIYYPRFHAGFPLEYKVLRALGAAGHELSGTRTLTPQYKRATDTTYADATEVITDPGSRTDLTDPLAEKAYDFAVEMANGAVTNSPVLAAFFVYSALRVTPLKRILATINAEDGQLSYEGTPMPKTWQDIRHAVEAAGESVSSVDVTNPAGEDIDVLVLGYSEGYLGIDSEKKKRRWTISVDMVQLSSGITRGLWSTAEGFTWAQLDGMTWAELESI